MDPPELLYLLRFFQLYIKYGSEERSSSRGHSERYVMSDSQSPRSLVALLLPGCCYCNSGCGYCNSGCGYWCV